jgi:ribosomal protein S18 acetylase RimI-like enzyme
MVNIRYATLNDLQQIQKLNHDVMSQNVEFDPDVNPNFDLEDTGSAFFKELIENNEGIFLVAIDGQDFVGYINGSPRKQINRSIKTFELENLGVISQYRKRRFASALYERFVAEVKRLGFTRIYLNCYIKNQIALDFYTKLGFKPIDISLEKDI